MFLFFRGEGAGILQGTEGELGALPGCEFDVGLAGEIEFGPRKDEKNPYGIEFTKCELLEWSIVTIPANQEALAEAKAGKRPV